MGKMKEIFMEIQESLGENVVVEDQLLGEYLDVKGMIESSTSKSEALKMLNTWYSFGKISGEINKVGEDLIKKEYE